jgi:hypothetical protein
MGWKQAIKDSGTLWHRCATLRARYLESPKYWLYKCPNQFVYRLRDYCLFNKEDKIEYTDVFLNNISVMEWLKQNARGRIAVVLDYQDHRVMASVPNAAPTDICTFCVSFSDKSLAMLWKLTFGGKMVDGRKMSLKLNL